MKRGHIVLISGAVLLVAGIALSAVWGMQFANVFLQDNSIIREVSVDPGQSVDTTRQVTDTSRSLTVAIHVQGADQQVRNDVRVVETVRGPSGAIVDTNEFSDDLFTSFKPEMAGDYVLTISNAGAESVAVDGTFGYMPFVDMVDGQQDPGELTGIIGGATLAVIGFFTIIAGIVVVVVDGKKKDGSTATEGGVTYRKD